MSNVTVFSPNLVGAGVGCDGVRGSYARIGWHTITRDSIVSASSDRAVYPKESVKNATTYDRWMPVSLPAWVAFDAGAVHDIDYFAIGSHNLQGATVTLQSSNDGINWDNVIALQPSRNNAVIAWFDAVSGRYWRVYVDDIPSFYIGVIHIGRILTMPRGLTGGRSTGVLQHTTDILPSKSDAGQFLGRSVIRRGHNPTYSWENLPSQWYRDNFDPFVESATKYPFFIATNPARWPDDVLYAWTKKDISPRYIGARDWMRVDLAVEAL